MANDKSNTSCALAQSFSGSTATNQRQKAQNTYTFGSNPSISHKPWRLPEVFGIGFLLVVGCVVEGLFE